MIRYEMYKILRFFHLISRNKYQKRTAKYTKDYKTVCRSGLFDRKWYLKHNPDVAAAGVDPLQHYLEIGWKEGRNPSEKFNTKDYLIFNTDVKDAGVNPLVHYVNFGIGEGRVIARPPKEQIKVIAKSHKGRNKGAIYTCITGGYDSLIQHTYQDRNWDYICFTDSENLLRQGTVGQWTIKPLRFDKLDNVRNARWHKTHPHCLLKDYKYSIWMDGNINVTGSMLFDNAQKCIDEHRILSVPEHPSRKCIYDEAIVVKALRKDLPEIVDKEITELRKLNFPENMGLNETNILFRYHNDAKCMAIMEDWFDFIEKYSRRDQLSFNYVLWKNGYNMQNFSGKRDVRYNPTNFLIIKSETHNGTIAPSSIASDLTMTIIMPIYNATEDVKIALNSLENAELSEKVKVVLVNDCSAQDTSDFLREFVKDKKRYTLLENEENLGFVKTCNRGIARANSDIIVLLNSDTMIPKHFEKRIQSCFDSNETIGVASPLASNSSLWNLPFRDGMSYEEMDAHIAEVSDCVYPDILCPEGFCFCIRKKVVDELGALDEIFGRGYCEETDLSLRALSAGYRIVLIDNLYIYHKRHASFGSEARKIQMDKNQSILWNRWKNLYDEQMKTVKMAAVRDYIKQMIYSRNSRFSLLRSQINFSKDLWDFDKMPPVAVNSQRKPTFNIFIPAINKNALTAGPLGILYFGEFLYKSGFNVRFLLTSKTSFDINILRSDEKLSEMADSVEFQYIGDRTETIEINPQDICVATLWNTAYMANYIQSKCVNKKFIYMIQDYESVFYANSSISALIDATYNMNYDAIFSTEILQQFFYQNKIGIFANKGCDSMFFNTAASPLLLSHDRFLKRDSAKKRFVFYGRPHRPRNMYELGLYVLQKAIEKEILKKDEWEFISVGATEKEIRLTADVTMRALPYMNVDDYRNKLSEMDLGLSLMLSPHPSMVPIDLALSGVVVVTNTYANKTEEVLQHISENILAANPDVNDILAKLEEGVTLSANLQTRYKNAEKATYCSQYDKMFTDEHLQWIKKNMRK